MERPQITHLLTWNERLRCGLVPSVVLLGLLGNFRLCSGDESARLHFETDVRPILKAHCFTCHGDEPEVAGGLDLRLVHLMATGGDSGPALVPGAAGESLLLQRIESGEMPPTGAGLSESERNILLTWISQGAATLREEPSSPPAEGEWTPEELGFWSFQPVVRPELPEVVHSELVQTPIDHFLLSVLEARGWTYSPPASKEVLLRRVCFDLTGLPPTLAQRDAFLANDSPSAFAELVEELLSSPAYGERWARHWLDAAGYADSDGYVPSDPERPWAWQYRDYVIRSLNDDKPFDRFLVEQLAGDELLVPPYENLTPEEIDLLVATGFLRMAPDGTGGGPDDPQLARNDVVAETIKAVSTNLLGLTIGCAQCHAHRYDPISQADYYRFRAIFEPAFNTEQWRTPNQRLVNLWSPEQHEQAAAVAARLSELEAERTAEFEAIIQDIFEAEVAKLEQEQQELARAARETKAEDRTPEQTQLLRDHPSLNVNRGNAYLYQPQRVNELNKRFDERKAEIQQERPADWFVACLTEVPEVVPATRFFFRGDHNHPREELLPADLSILSRYGAEIPVNDDRLPTTGRRRAWAEFLTNGSHPLLGRVLVNRVWRHHFGRGLVATPDDFGWLGERPSHPELLDWLANEFVAGGWSLKHLHRLIVLSRAYAQSSVQTDELSRLDPDNVWLARMPVRRLEAEAIRDNLLAVAGTLNPKMFGPPLTVTRDDVGQFVLGSGIRDGNGILIGSDAELGEERFRRSLYIQVRRSMPVSAMEPFDLPELSPNCLSRDSSTGATQSLLMLNGPFILEQASLFAERVLRESGPSAEAQVRHAWRLAFQAEPTDEEVIAALSYLLTQERNFRVQGTGTTVAGEETDPNVEPARLALASYCQALLASNRFLYVE